MRALFSWDVDRADPQFQQILIDLASTLPPGNVSSLTNHSVIVNNTTVSKFTAVNEALVGIAAKYPGRVFYVFSLHSNNDPIRGQFRTPAPEIATPPNG